MTRQQLLTGLLALLMAVPAAGQIIQRMESDVSSRAAAPLETAPLLDPEALKAIALANQPGSLVQEDHGLLRRTSERLRRKNPTAARKDWEQLIETLKKRGVEPDVDAMANWILSQAYLDNSELASLVKQLKFREEQRRFAHEAQTQLEMMKTSLERGQETQGLVIRPIILTAEYQPGIRPVENGEQQPATAVSVTSELKKTAAQIKQADENAQLANKNLQSALQKQQETVQLISDVSKMLHDSAKALIQKMGS